MACLIRSFLFFLVLLSTHVALSQETVQSSSAPEANPLNWQSFGYAEGRFSIQFPGTPETRKESFDSGQLARYKYTLTTRAEYVVTYADYSVKIDGSAAANRVLDDGVKDAIAADNSELLSISEISLGHYPGRELKKRLIDGAVMHVRMFLVSERLYKISVTLPHLENGTQEELALYETAATKFLNSFKLPQSFVSQPRTSAIQRTSQDCKNGKFNPENPSVGVLNGKALKLPSPHYPESARAARAQGKIVVEVVIDPTGKVVAARPVSGDPLLYGASVESARKARFSPTMLSGTPVCVDGIITYNFVLR